MGREQKFICRRLVAKSGSIGNEIVSPIQGNPNVPGGKGNAEVDG
jgi:hypothetical protein